jgi:hypothetical protein
LAGFSTSFIVGKESEAHGANIEYNNRGFTVSNVVKKIICINYERQNSDDRRTVGGQEKKHK